MENSNGLMDVVTKVIGKMVSSMEKECMLLPKELRNMANGKKAKDTVGLDEIMMVNELNLRRNFRFRTLVALMKRKT
jgi:hypothetical protein